jgi:hypothetical protein
MAESNPAETYILSYFSALDAVKRGRSTAEAQAADKSAPESEQATAAAAALDLTDEIGRLEAAHEAFMAKFTNINPPSADVVARAVALSTALAQNIAQSKQAVAILGTVTQFVDAWAKLSEGSPAASPSPQAANPAAKPPTNLSAKPKKASKSGTHKASTWLQGQLEAAKR